MYAADDNAHLCGVRAIPLRNKALYPINNSAVFAFQRNGDRAVASALDALFLYFTQHGFIKQLQLRHQRQVEQDNAGNNQQNCRTKRRHRARPMQLSSLESSFALLAVALGVALLALLGEQLYGWRDSKRAR